MLKTVRSKLIDVINSQFVYYTNNSWNKSVSYARNVKIHNIGIPREILDEAYNLTSKEWFYDQIRNFEIDEFEARHDNRLTIGFNGRSSGYAVLYKMNLKALDYKSRCNHCGNPTWYTTEIICPKCKVGTLKILKKPIIQKVVGGGVRIEDPYDSDDNDLVDMVCTLTDFNNTVDSMIDLTRDLARSVKNGDIDIETGEEPEVEEEVTVVAEETNQLSLF